MIIIKVILTMNALCGNMLVHAFLFGSVASSTMLVRFISFHLLYFSFISIIVSTPIYLKLWLPGVNASRAPFAFTYLFCFD
jgi:hypothetical protein